VKDLAEVLAKVTGQRWDVWEDEVILWRSHAVPEVEHTRESGEELLRSYASELEKKLEAIQQYFKLREQSRGDKDEN